MNEGAEEIKLQLSKKRTDNAKSTVLRSVLKL